jgi:Nucleotidyl transferase AbiEii toxin, Type IV TA system
LEFAKVLATLIAFFEERQLRFGVAGALGLHAYGLSRATGDLDLVVERRAQPELLRFLDGLGYERLHVSTGYSNHLHRDAALGRLDFIYVDEATGETLFGQARRIELFPGQTVAVPRPEHLAAMKVAAIHNDPSRTFKDLADVQFLLSLPGIDEDLIRAQFERYGMKEKFDELKKALSRA